MPDIKGPFEVYEDYEGGLAIIDGTTRTVLYDVYAYDDNDEARRVRADCFKPRSLPGFFYCAGLSAGRKAASSTAISPVILQVPSSTRTRSAATRASASG